MYKLRFFLIISSRNVHIKKNNKEKGTLWIVTESVQSKLGRKETSKNSYHWLICITQTFYMFKRNTLHETQSKKLKLSAKFISLLWNAPNWIKTQKAKKAQIYAYSKSKICASECGLMLKYCKFEHSENQRQKISIGEMRSERARTRSSMSTKMRWSVEECRRRLGGERARMRRDGALLPDAPV